MFKKIKLYIINKLLNWLEIDKLKDDYGKFKDEYHTFKNQTRIDINYNEKQIHNINELFSVAADVGVRDHRNWAVVCIEGKPNYVKFVDLNKSDIREIQRFLKQFEGCSRRIVDAPFNMDFAFRDDVLHKIY